MGLPYVYTQARNFKQNLEGPVHMNTCTCTCTTVALGLWYHWFSSWRELHRRCVTYGIVIHSTQVHAAHGDDRLARTAAFFKEVCLRTARLVALWQAVGFCHGYAIHTYMYMYRVSPTICTSETCIGVTCTMHSVTWHFYAIILYEQGAIEFSTA